MIGNKLREQLSSLQYKLNKNTTYTSKNNLF